MRISDWSSDVCSSDLTAATSSQICDGASAALIVSEQALKDHGLTPRARIHHISVTAGDPVIMPDEPLFATEKAPKQGGMQIGELDAYEVNAAFAPLPRTEERRVGK